MCLAVPMKVLKIDGNVAQVALGGVQREVRLDLVDRHPEIGDYVIVHAGFAIRMIEEEEAKLTLSYFEEMLSSDAEASE
jgi:hydrogenase expression/formation protein HypC